MTGRWIIRRARRQAARHRGAMLAVAVAFFALTFSAGAALLAGRLGAGVTGALTENVHVIAYLREDMTDERAEALAGLLRRLPGVAAVRPVGSDEALRRLRAAAASHAGGDAALASLEPGFLPRSLEVALVPSERLPQEAADLGRRLRTIAGVADVDAMADGLGRLLTWVRVGRLVGLAFFALALLGALAALMAAEARGRAARSEEAEVLTLLGATPWAIRAPAAVSVTIASIGGAGAALLALWAAFRPTARALAALVGGSGAPPAFLDAGQLGLALVCAAVVGAAVGYRATALPRPSHA